MRYLVLIILIILIELYSLQKSKPSVAQLMSTCPGGASVVAGHPLQYNINLNRNDNGPRFDSRWVRCINRASRPSQETVNGGAVSK